MIAISDPIGQLINSQYGFLSSMLEHFPYLLDEWIHKQEEEVEQLAREFAEGDNEVYMGVFNSEISRVDSCYDEEQLFNQAMLIMVYSYYESSLLRLTKEKGINPPRPSVIAEKMGTTLDKELVRISDFIFSKVEPLRDQLCHNNSGTLLEKNKERAEVSINYLLQKKYISIDDGRIISIERNFIKKILDDEHKLLLCLAEICGFKTRWYYYKDGEMVMCDCYEELKKQKEKQ